VKISRRRFLQISSALALQACAGGGRLRLSGNARPKDPRFYVPSPRYYLKFDQDFSRQTLEKKLKAPSAVFRDTHHSLLTVANGDGTGIRKVLLPGLAHSTMVDGDLVYIVPTDRQPWLYALDADTLEIARFVQVADSDFKFGGHAALIPGTNHFAISTNGSVAGKYDRVSIRERDTLKEVASVSSYGFEAHDLKVSADGKRLFTGHYGSMFGTGPYKGTLNLDLKDLEKKKKAYGASEYQNIYPASVTVVELSSGKLLNRYSSVDGGAHCHFALGSEERVYLPHQPSLIANRSDVMTNPWFGEGVHGPDQLSSFLPKMKAGFGTSIAFDEKNGQILIPARWSEDLKYFSENKPEEFQSQDLRPQVPKLEKTHGLVMHPDGDTYVITGDNWFTTFERKTHRLVAERTFPVDLFIHAHVSVG
jgi:hypothetical protein